MRANVAGLCLSLLIGAGICSAQTTPVPPQPDYSSVYCSGFVSDQKVPDEVRLVSGEQSNVKITFSRGDYVYINRGSSQGVREGDQFSVVRPDSDTTKVPWFKWQDKLVKAMGQLYDDLGHIRVVKVHPNTSIAEVTFSCNYMQRGDILRPYSDRPAPPFKDLGAFDHFAPVSGKPVGMVVVGKDFSQTYGQNSAIYVNLGTAQGVKVGDYVRLFRYQGTDSETVTNEKGYQYKLFGFGSSPQRYEWKDLPREVLGEGIVLSVTKNSSTVLITFSSIEIYAGDYVEVE